MNDFGYGQYAASNDLVVLYPLMKWDWYNPYTCFDTRGPSTLWSNGYMTNKGPQMEAVKGMIERVLKTRDP